MSKITFRADDELVEEVERLDTSKSEVMRKALRAYLDGQAEPDAEERTLTDPEARSLDDIVADRVDALVADRIDELVERRLADRQLDDRRSPESAASGRDVNVNISLDGQRRGADPDPASVRHGSERDRGREPQNDRVRRSDHGRDRDAADSTQGRDTRSADSGRKQEHERTCAQCGDSLGDDHVYCPNCGQKATQRVFCECGDEVRSDWAFCPHCGRRTASADVLEK